RTGHRPITEARGRMSDYPEPVHGSRNDAQSASRADELRALRRTAPDSALRFPGFHAPRDLDELACALEAAPDSLLLAGGTDVGVWATKQLRDLPPIVYLGTVRELLQIRNSDAGLWIGAGVPMIVAAPGLLAHYPSLAEQAHRFASPPVCTS